MRRMRRFNQKHGLRAATVNCKAEWGLRDDPIRIPVVRSNQALRSKRGVVLRGRRLAPEKTSAVPLSL
jgi:hypothetical protein